MPNSLEKERSLMQKMLYDRPYGSWQKEKRENYPAYRLEKIAYKYGT